ncbi:MAG: ribose 5-phosphate isomerase B [Deltaproteobacteria bacterium]|nr:ribose 5-phosphate isomerase B [Deltaproteobacteria bacterium]
MAIASDHAGFSLKELLKTHLNSRFEVLDLGTNSEASVDYPDYAQSLAKAILSKQAERGILICGSGVGIGIAANKFKGIRAAICHDTYSAHQGVEHDHMNVLTLGARIIGEELAKEVVETFVNAVPSQDERHLRRVSKVEALEQ